MTRISALLREPLLHFLVLGGSVFAVDGWTAAQREDPNLIIVSSKVKEHARSSFRDSQGRDPSDAELERLRAHWVDTEILYREGLALKLEQGDQTLRERVAKKTLKLIESNLQVPEADEATLRVFFEQHRAKYDAPPRFDFSQALPEGDITPARAQALVAALQREQSDVQAGVRLFEKHPRPAIASSFGAEFAQALDRMPLGQWQVVPSEQGPTIVRLETRLPATPAAFERERTRVQRDWTEAKLNELRSAALRELSRRYRVEPSGGSS